MNNTNSEIRQCQNCKNDFEIEAQDFTFYEKVQVPAPTWCSECRLIRRLVVRNERALYWTECRLCGEKIFSAYSPESPYTVYCVTCWSSDKWDGVSYGRGYDWSKPFLKQWHELSLAVPRYSIYNINTLNSPFGGNVLRDSNRVYLSYSIVVSEDVYYSKNIDSSKSVFDSLNTIASENIYQNVLGHKNYNCSFLLLSRNCLDSAFLYDCANCQNCFLSSNLRNQEFVFRNEKLSKERYWEERKKLEFGSHQVQQRLVGEFRNSIESCLHKYANIVNCVECIGNDLLNSKRAHLSFDGHELENVAFTLRTLALKDSYDVSYGGGIGGVTSELIYESQGAGVSASSRVRFNIHGASGGHNRDLQYTGFCGKSSHLFGCVGLRNKQYCILNQQYTKESFDELRTKIIEHMNAMPYTDAKGRTYRYGEFFPPELSPFAYNETIAQEYFPLTKEEAEAQGYRWRDPEERNYKIKITNDQLPDHIKDVTDEIIDQVIECGHKGACNEQCTTAFKIIPEELSFYRRMHLPLPRLCPNCRHYQRLKQRNPLKLWHRKCTCNGATSHWPLATSAYQNTVTHFHGLTPCPNEFETSYAPDRKEIVYCESCYNSEVA